MTSRKIKGIYQRGNIFWLTHGSGKHRLQESLKTSDYADAVAKAKEILNQPLLNTTTGFKPDLADYAENQTKNGVWTRNSRKSKYSALLMFGEDLNWTPLPALTTPKIQHWYDDQCIRICAIGDSGTTAHTSASLLQRITAQLKSSLREIRHQLARRRRDPAWNFSQCADHDTLAQQMRQALMSDLERMRYQCQTIREMIARWKAAAERLKQPRRR
jgi:hypothetical protein